MQLLDLTLDSAADNLALDEALLDTAESNLGRAESDVGANYEILRLWESRELIVVAGSSSHLADEVNLDICRRRNIPVLRRASGGATIVTGPGCLMYAVVLSYHLRPHLRPINAAHRYVLEMIASGINTAIAALRDSAGSRDQQSRLYDDSRLPPTAYRLPPAARAGTSDLALGEKKFSGNSLRCKRNHFLYHGTLLYDFPLHEIATLLKMPPRQPIYRNARPHSDFITNLPLTSAQLRAAIAAAFNAEPRITTFPRTLTQQLVAEKYSRSNWNERM